MTRISKLVVPALAVGLLGGFAAASQAASSAHGQSTRLRQGQIMQVGPGPVLTVLHVGSYRLRLRLTPNRASRTGIVAVTLLQRNRPINRARVRLTVTMLDMNMGSFTAPLPQTTPGTYTRTFPVVGMSGRWSLRLDVTPTGTKRVSVTVADRIGA